MEYLVAVDLDLTWIGLLQKSTSSPALRPTMLRAGLSRQGLHNYVIHYAALQPKIYSL